MTLVELEGTFKSFFRIGKKGLKLHNKENTALEITNENDELVNIKAKSPLEPDDLVTLEYLNSVNVQNKETDEKILPIIELINIKVSNGVKGIYKIKHDDIINAMIISNDETLFYDNDKKLVHIVCFSKGNIILSSEIVYKKLINSDEFESTSKDDEISFKIMK